MLLAALDSRRPTADVDLPAPGVSDTEEHVSDLVREILVISAPEDGLTFHPGRMTARRIRDQELYADRSRVSGVARSLDTARRLSSVTVLAEKVATMIDRGAANTRERDLADGVLPLR